MIRMLSTMATKLMMMVITLTVFHFNGEKTTLSKAFESVLTRALQNI